MRRLFRPAALLLVVLAITLPAIADKAHSSWNRGKDAEARQDYEKAYDYYQEAFSLKPKDLRYRAAYERIKFLAAASHVHRGQIMRDSGKLDEALVEFQKAALIDRRDLNESPQVCPRCTVPSLQLKHVGLWD